MTDTAYLVSYSKYRQEFTALVIAPNPVRAKAMLDDHLEGRDREGFKPESVTVTGELKDRVKTAEANGVAAI